MKEIIDISEIINRMKNSSEKEELLLFRELIANKNVLAKTENIIAPM